ncbi:MAG: hypothetical protein WCY54_01135 [Syntrophales bacterium]
MVDLIPRQEIMTRKEFTLLMGTRNGPCASIYMPTPWVGAETQQNQIRFKNLLRIAAEKLSSKGVRTPEAEEMLSPAQELLRNSPFWRKQNTGSAAFVSRGFFRFYRLPLDFQEMVHVSDRFLLKPILPLFGSSGKFYVLAVSQKKVRFLQGARNCIVELDIQNVPKSLAEIVRFDVSDRQIRTQPSVKGSTTFRGHGVWSEDIKEQILRYFKQIDRGLQEYLKEEKAPVVFAGVDYLFPIYREANSYPLLQEKPITGNPEGLRAEELGRTAWPIVQPYYMKIQEDALDQYRQSAGTGLTSNRLEEILPAAYHGRVGVLFLAAGKNRWGRFDPATGSVSFHETAGAAETNGEDLLDVAAIYAYLNGGAVYELPPEIMPERSEVSALLRY